MEFVKKLQDKIAMALGLYKAGATKEKFVPANVRAERRHRARWEARRQRKGSRAFNESLRRKRFRLDTIAVQQEILHGERVVNPHMLRNVQRGAEFALKAEERRKRQVERVNAARAAQRQHDPNRPKRVAA